MHVVKPLFVKQADIPKRPGVYIYKDITGKVIYVGKAINLYNRVSSYFNSRHTDPKTIALVENIASFETIEVLSEIEALILEANLIKKYLPLYNIRLTDDKDYLYIKVTKEDFPKILIARRGELEDALEFFGPFPSSRTVRTTLKRLRRIFPYCTQGEARRINEKPCFFYHLSLCPGVCAGKIKKQDYRKIINNFINFMRGNTRGLISDFHLEMKEYSACQEYEKASALKRTIEGLEYLTQSTNAQVYLENPNFVEDQNQKSLEELKKCLKLKNLPDRIECFDISNLQGQQATGSLVVLTSGEVDKKWYRRFKIHLEGKPSDVAQMKEMIARRLEHFEWPKPDLIIVDGGRGQVRGAKEELDKAGWDIPVFGLAKRMEWLYTPGTEIIKLPRTSLSIRLLQKIRDEAHRFAISYHRKLRQVCNFGQA